MQMPESPYSFPRLYASQHRQQLPDLQFYLALAGQTGSDLLELGCGTGRLSLPLVAHGMRVTGVDLDPHMLAFARQEAAALPEEQRSLLRLVQMDVCRLQLPDRYDLVLFPYHSIGHIGPGTPLQQLAEGCARHLRVGGRCVLSLLQPDDELCRPDGSELRHLERFCDPDGHDIDCYESTRYSAATRRLRFDWFYDLADDREMLHISNELFLHTGEEVQQACMAAGLQLERSYGDFDGSPYTPDSPELLQIYRRFH
ncbi:class I SAM-dependent methyltransferase [Spirochaeta africana]|uniref:Methylase involved in ubiquinone/menaquinone biosynthesis n=1 Tax=Spirochaeta africana (strain ATCC 700263 / DSM 8902 / Z-7692) TaxID=889378 RepID=H9ULX0_SPIAZ|nr:class I SAM-dependent methyltransferase [Spirochaeta africana]AFG38513.1 methylase involved in ubiquinone/menaquinone biosynthesis [Spirochaeta africana DSM 8902]